LLKSERFSEDLDFTTELSAKKLNALMGDAVKKVNLTAPNTTLERTHENKLSYTGRLKYQSETMKHPLTIHLDFSLRGQPETSKETVLKTDFPVALRPIVRHLDWPEVLAEKIRAFLVRKKGRDVYDIWFMLSRGIELDWPMINRKTKLYNMQTSLRDLMEGIEQFEDKKLKNDLGKFLPAHNRHFTLYVKEQTHQQLVARENFTIKRSDNVDYTEIPGHSYSGNDKLLTSYEEVKTAKIKNIKRQDENSIIVSLVTDHGIEANAYIRARNKNGVRELNIIERYASEHTFKNQSYDSFIHHAFAS
jgi:predicted nucleotidyltransferase component of viral defense system